jgi:hypothetical protein
MTPLIDEANRQHFIAIELLKPLTLMYQIRIETSSRPSSGKDKANETCGIIIGVAGHDDGNACDC